MRVMNNERIWHLYVFVRFYPHFSLHHELEVCDVFCDHEHDREYLNGEVDEDVGKSYDRMLRDKIKHGRLIMTAMMIQPYTYRD